MKVIVFGNSGSGKSTFSAFLAEKHQLAHLDLDTVAWKSKIPTEREDLSISTSMVRKFCKENEKWVIEGCYSSLINEAALYGSQMIFLNPGVEACQENCRNRPWESHKYGSKDEQDGNLEMLLDWVSDYEKREDEFSLVAHRQLFESFHGVKHECNSNEETHNLSLVVTPLAHARVAPQL